MNKKYKITQVEFSSLEEFIEGHNNFYAYFLDNCEWGNNKREKDYFKKFRELYPELERELTKKVTHIRSNHLGIKSLPYEQLFEAYQKMSLLVEAENETERKKHNLHERCLIS
jgi:hypothetical protein